MKHETTTTNEGAPAGASMVVRPSEAARLLGVSRATISAYRRRGLLCPVRCGAQAKRATGYTMESITALVNGAEVLP